MENNLIYKANALIEASYALSTNEQRLLLACISQIDSSKPLDANKPFYLTVGQARDLFYAESERNNAYRDLRAACDRFYERDVKMKSEDGQWERRTRFVSTVDFDEKKQEAILYFAVGILPYLSQLKENFTKYRVANMVQLTSTHAIRVYELIVMWYSQNQTYKELEIDEFKDLLGLGLKYKQTGQLNQFVIEPVVEQINGRTDFQLEIKLRKIGRSFQYIQLRFNRHAEAEADDLKRKQNKITADKRLLSKPKPSKKLSEEPPPKHLEPFGNLEKLLLQQIQEQHPEVTEQYIRGVSEQKNMYLTQTLELIKKTYKGINSFSLEKTD